MSCALVCALGCDRGSVEVEQQKEPPAQVVVEEAPTPALEPVAATTPRPNAPASFADLVERARPAVINIYTRTRVKGRRLSPLLPFAPPDRVGESLGSGFIIDPSGLALTNHHVIDNATDIEVRLLDDRRFKATVVGDDPKTDTALIKIEGVDNLPHLEMADSDAMRVGDWVVAIGNPLGLTSTVTAGIVSAVGRRNVPLGGELRYKDFIQTDASINPGNSGGALLNMSGEVVGINTAISAEAQGIGFAIPMNMVKEILDQLKDNGRVKRSWLGIYVDDVPAALRAQVGLPDRVGALVMDVVPGGPADRAKLRKGDVIVKLDGEEVSDAAALSWVAGNKGIGKTVTMELMRGNQRMATKLRLGALPD
jgi:Do/DeqQ family serine protease